MPDTMRMNADASCTYKKDEKTGEWLVWVRDLEGRPGQSVSVATRTGKVNLEKLVEKVWEKPDGSLSLWKIEQD